MTIKNDKIDERWDEYYEEIGRLILKAANFVGTESALQSIACIDVALDHAVRLREEVERLRKDNDNLLKFIKDNYGCCPYDYSDEIVRPGECTEPGKECGYGDNIGPCWMIYITKKMEG